MWFLQKLRLSSNGVCVDYPGCLVLTQPQPHLIDPLPILTRHAIVRRLTSSDLPQFQAYRHDEDISRYQGWSAQSDEDALAFLDEMAIVPLFRPDKWTQLAIAESRTSKLIGDIGVYVSDDGTFAEIGFSLAKAAHGSGRATAAVSATIDLVLRWTDVVKIIGIPDARNIASIKLLERVGMRPVESRETMFDGAPCTEIVFIRERVR